MENRFDVKVFIDTDDLDELGIFKSRSLKKDVKAYHEQALEAVKALAVSTKKDTKELVQIYLELINGYAKMDFIENGGDYVVLMFEGDVVKNKLLVKTVPVILEDDKKEDEE